MSESIQQGAALRQFSLYSIVNTFAHMLERMGYSNLVCRVSGPSLGACGTLGMAP